jgi:hypothetical protein
MWRVSFAPVPEGVEIGGGSVGESHVERALDTVPFGSVRGDGTIYVQRESLPTVGLEVF